LAQHQTPPCNMYFVPLGVLCLPSFLCQFATTFLSTGALEKTYSLASFGLRVGLCD
jgi:hypothetical protein